MAVSIRPIAEDDAGAVAEFFQVVDSETTFMLFEPGERNNTPEMWRQRIADMHAGGVSEGFVAVDQECAGLVAGLLLARGEDTVRVSSLETRGARTKFGL